MLARVHQEDAHVDRDGLTIQPRGAHLPLPPQGQQLVAAPQRGHHAAHAARVFGALVWGQSLVAVQLHLQARLRCRAESTAPCAAALRHRQTCAQVNGSTMRSIVRGQRPRSLDGARGAWRCTVQPCSPACPLPCTRAQTRVARAAGAHGRAQRPQRMQRAAAQRPPQAPALTSRSASQPSATPMAVQAGQAEVPLVSGPRLAPLRGPRGLLGGGFAHCSGR